MYAVIETGSKQYRVEVGTELQVELLDVEPGQTITLDRVLLVADGDTAAIGRPVVDGAKVTAEVVRRERGVKTISFKYRPKARRRVKKGHRQELTVLRIDDIVLGGKSAGQGSPSRRGRRPHRARAPRGGRRAPGRRGQGPRREARPRPPPPRRTRRPPRPRVGAPKTTTTAKTADTKADAKAKPATKASAKADTAKPAKAAKPSADAPKKAARTKKDE